MSSDPTSSDESESRTEPERYTADEARNLSDSAFEESTIDRRTFLSVAAATGAALTLPSTAAAEIQDDSLTDLAEFAVNSTPDDHQVTLVLEFENTDALNAFFDEYGEPNWDIESDSLPAKVETREEPTPAAHAYLTSEELRTTLNEIGGVDRVDFSPGANPFWKLGDAYDDRVFPVVEEARDYVSHVELAEGLTYLESAYSDRLRVHSIGQSPGFENLFTGADADPKDVYVAELTKNIQDEESFQAKDKAVFSLAIHGDEPAGRVAATRIIEEAAKGEADDFEDVLDDIAIVFVFTNPDGWAVRKPQYQFQDRDETEQVRYKRGNAAIGDTNRQYPTMGWVNPGYWPAEPEGTPDVRPDDPEGRGYDDMVPDALAVVEHLRGYENVEYLCDYHMMDTADSMVLNLESNAPYEQAGTHNLDEVNIRIGDAMEDHWGGPEAIAADTQRAAEDIDGDEGYVPERLLDYGTIFDSLGYQITGGLLGWAGQPEEFGGLGAVTVAPELVLRDAYDFKPYIERHLGMAYRLSMREYTEMTAASTEAQVATGGQDTAYVTSETLTRSSADLPFTDNQSNPGNGQGPPDHANGSNVQRGRGRAGRSGGVQAQTDSSTHSLAAEFHAEGIDEGVVRIVNPGGQAVREIDLADPKTDESGHFYIPNPEEGNWSIEYDGDADIDVETVLLESDDEYPNPEETLGYSQREYEVNPMQFFEDLEPYLESGSLDAFSVHDVSVGRLLRGRSGQRHYDNLVISHSDGIDNQDYIAAIEDFVEAGGNLVLTDAGLNLLAELEIGDAAAISEEDISSGTMDIPNLEDRDLDHQLLTDIRPIQQEIWKVSQLGYTTGNDSPVWVLDTDAFEAAGGSKAGNLNQQTYWEQNEDGDWEWIYIPGEVGAGTLAAGDGEISFIGSLLPPANQRELHPFGMADYTLSFMGHTLICNALGFEQRRYVSGELVGTWGELQ